MAKKRRRHSNEFKFKVALEALKGLQTINDAKRASAHNIHPNQVGKWKRQLQTEGPLVFSSNTAKQLQEQEARETELYEHIGRLKMELEWLKKKATQFS